MFFKKLAVQLLLLVQLLQQHLITIFQLMPDKVLYMLFSKAWSTTIQITVVVYLKFCHVLITLFLRL